MAPRRTALKVAECGTATQGTNSEVTFPLVQRLPVVRDTGDWQEQILQRLKKKKESEKAVPGGPKMFPEPWFQGASTMLSLLINFMLGV